jgi:amino acid adenylation domain-containing protein
MNLIESIARAGRDHAGRVALTAVDGSCTYSELHGRVAGIAHEIRRHGAGARIGVLTGDDIGTYASILAALATGAAYVPLNRKNPAARNRLVVERAELELVLATQPSRELTELTRAPSSVEVIYTNSIAPSDGLRWNPPAPDDLAYLFFTSGTTGVPKGVPIRHCNLDAFMTAIFEDASYAFGPSDRFLQMFELTFDLSVMSLFAPLAIGASCHVVPDSGIASLQIARILGEREISVALLVPSVLSYLHRYFEELRFPALRHNLFCGEALSHRLTAAWAASVPAAEIRNVYGPTEATIFCTEFKWDVEESAAQSVNDIVPIGRPLAGTSLLILDDAGKLAAPGTQGELCLMGEQLAAGYWRDPERSEAAFISAPGDGGLAYRTGDLAFVNEQGNYIYCGRSDAQIQVDGHRVELAEVEYYLRMFSDGTAAATAPFRTADGRQEFVAFLESTEDLEARALEYLRSKVPQYMIPRRVISVAAFPLNLNGKVDRGELLRRYPV